MPARLILLIGAALAALVVCAAIWIGFEVDPAAGQTLRFHERYFAAWPQQCAGTSGGARERQVPARHFVRLRRGVGVSKYMMCAA